MNKADSYYCGLEKWSSRLAHNQEIGSSNLPPATNKYTIQLGSVSMFNNMKWQPDLPDFRDYSFTGVTAVEDLPAKVDLREGAILNLEKGPFDRATLDMFEFVYKKDFAGSGFSPSQTRMFGPGGPRQALVMPRVDLKEIIKRSADIINGQLSYFRMKNELNELKQCLADGYPFIFGFSKYSSFGKAVPSGAVNIPIIDETIVGSVITLAVGYDNSTESFIIKSYREPGDNGYFYMPYDYITNINLCEDFWTLRKTV